MVDGDINVSVATLTSDYVAKTIDHSLLSPELDAAAVLDGCAIFFPAAERERRLRLALGQPR